MTYFSEYHSPIGPLTLVSDGEALTHLLLDGSAPEGALPGDLPVLENARRWLDGYFRGEAPALTFPVAPEGTDFQRKVWHILLAIPSGATRTYGSIAQEMARLLGKETMSAQAIGGAVGRNPIPIAIPCHRVVGADGGLTGYAGGLEKKRWLLRHEGWLKEEGGTPQPSSPEK